MDSEVRAVFNNVKKIETTISTEGATAILSATGTGCSLDAKCDLIGSSFSLVSGGKESVFIIAKGSLSSASFYTSRNKWLLIAASVLLGFGIGSYLFGTDSSLGMLLFGGSFILFILFLVLREAKLEFESSGGKTVSFQFTGSAAGRASDFAKFCTDAILIDKHMDDKIRVSQTSTEIPF